MDRIVIDDDVLDEYIEEVSSCNSENLFALLEIVIDEDIYGSDYDNEVKEQMRDRILSRIKEEI